MNWYQSIPRVIVRPFTKSSCSFYKILVEIYNFYNTNVDAPDEQLDKLCLFNDALAGKYGNLGGYEIVMN
jgi:hypothetical protein